MIYNPIFEEEKMNSLELAENMLFESDKFFMKDKKEEIITPAVKEPIVSKAA